MIPGWICRPRGRHQSLEDVPVGKKGPEDVLPGTPENNINEWSDQKLRQCNLVVKADLVIEPSVCDLPQGFLHRYHFSYPSQTPSLPHRQCS